MKKEMGGNCENNRADLLMWWRQKCVVKYTKEWRILGTVTFLQLIQKELLLGRKGAFLCILEAFLFSKASNYAQIITISTHCIK